MPGGWFAMLMNEVENLSASYHGKQLEWEKQYLVGWQCMSSLKSLLQSNFLIQIGRNKKHFSTNSFDELEIICANFLIIQGLFTCQL